MKSQRLDTDGLIQTCRNNYNQSKLDQKIKELELLLHLRTKQKDMMAHQVITIKEQAAIKIAYLETQVTQLKRQCADLRYNSVKNKRIQNQKAEKQLQLMKNNYDLLIIKQRQQNMITYKQLQLKHRQQINRLQQQYQRKLKMSKDERQSYKNMFQNGPSSQLIIKTIQEEKNVLIRMKKDVQEKNQMLKQILVQKQQDYVKECQQKNEIITKLNSQIMGLKLQQRMLRQRLQAQKIKEYDSSSAIQRQLQHLKIQNIKLQGQNQKYKKLLLSKNEEIVFRQCQNLNSQRKIIKNVVQCNHHNLIKQLQRSLSLKTQENSQLKLIIDSWSAKIQFDQPLSSRINQIQQKRCKALQTNKQISNILRPNMQNNKKTIR